MEGRHQGPSGSTHRRGAVGSDVGGRQQRRWTTYFKAKYDVEMYITDNLIGGPNSCNKDGRTLFWGVPGRTLENVICGIRNGAPRLEMPSSPPPSPQWQPRRTTYSSSSHSSSSGPARSTPSSSYRSAPHPRERGGALLIPAGGEGGAGGNVASAAAVRRQQRLIANSDDPEDCPGLRAAFLASMNDKDAWRGDLDAAIAMSIRDSGKPLVDLTDDGETGPSGLVKDEPVEERVKQEVVTDDMYNFHQYYDASGRRKYF
ncbi:hypothetical protein QYE76_067424 [Lolium multiflorum]|uniref:Uncharacterized protein n=1 Tax=Lolium multiflorum TaxID=4521 RepID=A0AAD8SCT4_LOLMU|nr:hypothetical protein QYE76_067424 [Lolium multiflorum]